MNTDLKIAYTTNNSLEKLLNKQKEKNPKSKFNNSGVYQLTCPTCQKKYIGQTGGLSTYGFKNITEISNMQIINPNLPNIS